MFKLRNTFGSIVLGVALAGGVLVTGLAPQVALAQATSGNIFISVVDGSGAALPNAKVVVANLSTGIEVTVTTNGSGEVTVQNLLPGKYNITGTASGFSTYVLKNFELKLNETPTARLALPVASQATNIEVTSDASVSIDTTTTQLATTFESKQIADLPTASVGLGVLNLSLLAPGVASSGGIGAGTGPSVGGQRPRANNYNIEGIDNNNKSVTGPLIYVPNDVVGEFTLVTNQFSPEFGHSTGGQFNTNIKSGTNKFHGTAYEFFQNRNLNAENAVQGGKIPNPRYDDNRYGGEVGGPIIPNRLFFLGAFERESNGQSAQGYICTPTAAGLDTIKNYPGLSATNLGIYLKYVPVAPTVATGGPSGNDIACGNAVAKDGDPEILNLYPGSDANPNKPGNQPNADGDYVSGTPTPVELGNYLVNAPNFTNFHALTTGFDYTVSSKDSLRGRYIYNRQVSPDIASSLPVFFTTLPYRYHLIALSEYHNFTPNLINEARLGFNRYYNATPAGNFEFPGLDVFPNLTFGDQGFLNIGPDGNAPQSTIQNMYQFTDNISWIKGKHTWKFGFDGRKFISPQSFTQRARGDYQYDLLSEYLHDVASDDNSLAQRSTGSFFYYGDQTALYGYANDTWKVTPKFSLNMGLRYEFTSVPVGERAQALNITASSPGLVTFATPKPQYKNFTPRVGIVYAPDENTSIRLGFGMAMDVLYDNLGTLSFPPQYSSTQDVGVGDAPAIGSDGFLAKGGLPPGKGTLQTFSTIAKQRAATSAYVPDQKLPYAETWSLGIEHVFHRDYTLEVRYLGTRGIHLPAQVRLNKQNKTDSTHYLPTYYDAISDAEKAALTNTFASINARSNFVDKWRHPADEATKGGFTGNVVGFVPASESNYNGLAANLTRRFQRGLQLNLAYTWSKTMDDATADVFSTTLTPRRPQDFQNVAGDYSRSALDRTHRLTFEAVYDLPFFKNSNWLVRNLAGNWEVAPIYTYESPEYATTLSGNDANGNGDGAYIDRPIWNPNGKGNTGSAVTPIYDPSRSSACGTGDDEQPITECPDNLVAYSVDDPTARYVQTGTYSLSTAARNTLPINPINNLDATAVKRFSFSERYRAEFQAQAFNVLNHAQYIPGTLNNINSPGYTDSLNYQTVTSGQFAQPGAFFKANARSMQLVLKFIF